MKNKEGKSVTEAFKDVVKKSQRKPDKIWSDRGKEFYNKTFKDYLQKNNIEIYSTNSDLKAVFVERFNRTLLDLIKMDMYIEGKAKWIDKIDKALEVYNNIRESRDNKKIFPRI